MRKNTKKIEKKNKLKKNIGLGGNALRGNSICGFYLLCLYLYNLKSKILNPKIKHNNLRIGHENKKNILYFFYCKIIKINIILLFFLINYFFFIYVINIYLKKK